MLRLLRLAVSGSLRPTTLLRRVQPYSEWDDLDFDLLSALDRLEKDTSEITSLPWWMTRTGHPQVEYVVDTVEDAAEAALDRYDEKQGKKKKKPGVHRYVRAEAIGDFEIEGGLAREAMLLYASQQNPDDHPDAELGDLIDRHRPDGGYRAEDYG